ncbi:hypothetical protein DNH61_09125 [Paenibacillus sambharensis]|uniref:Group-specific protein n=1 Tax=Paenibacillus sambharensis TaxID=1803190 RepID=A0A2W1LBF2_9BACL|nr:hypothetical protein [Paenibacillus sambharensis]PZD96069.1 hypothetical protein DNH61_09125 [Paenibacillus sambharensis]
MGVRLTRKDAFVDTALLQFIFPFSIKDGLRDELREELLERGYQPFTLEDRSLEDAYYGEGYRVSHQHLERYYLPFTGSILFPDRHSASAFQRLSRVIEEGYELSLGERSISFCVQSVDVVICPFDLGFITTRVSIEEKLPYSLVLEFADRFRDLEDINSRDEHTSVRRGEENYGQMEEFIFKKVAPGIMPYLGTTDLDEAYYETLPYFVDERMFVLMFCRFAEGFAIDSIDMYRALHLDGMNENGEPVIGSSNPDFIKRYCDQHVYDRWSPGTVYGANEHTFCCLTTTEGRRERELAGEMYGELYYGLLLCLFHKIVLLKLSSNYSTIRLEYDRPTVEKLIRSITNLSAKYYFLEIASQLKGKELFKMIRRSFGIHELYIEVKETLGELYDYQDRTDAKTQNYLLMLLTLYTVIGGIYGMNQVIEDLDGQIDWRAMLKYSLFEHIALFVTLSGLVIGFVLAVVVTKKWLSDYIRRRNS